MASVTRTYSADMVTATWGIIRLEEGFARGTFLREIRNGASFTKKDNGYGDTVDMFNARTSGRLMVQINRGSETYQKLVTQANLDLVLRSLALPIVIRDRNTKTVSIYNKCRPQNIPGFTASTAPSVVPWVFTFSQALQQPLGFNNNVAGS